MSIKTVIIGILLFALATSVIYVWGMRKQRDQSKDLMNLLFSTGESKLKKYLKTHDAISRVEAENMFEGMQVKLPFSSARAVVTDKRDFTEKLLAYMVRTGQLEKEGNIYSKHQ